jgi:hypothetical protein
MHHAHRRAGTPAITNRNMHTCTLTPTRGMHIAALTHAPRDSHNCPCTRALARMHTHTRAQTHAQTPVPASRGGSAHMYQHASIRTQQPTNTRGLCTGSQARAHTCVTTPTPTHAHAHVHMRAQLHTQPFVENDMQLDAPMLMCTTLGNACTHNCTDYNGKLVYLKSQQQVTRSTNAHLQNHMTQQHQVNYNQKKSSAHLLPRTLLPQPVLCLAPRQQLLLRVPASAPTVPVRHCCCCRCCYCRACRCCRWPACQRCCYARQMLLPLQPQVVRVGALLLDLQVLLLLRPLR